MSPATVSPMGQITSVSRPRATSAARACASSARRPASADPSTAINRPGYDLCSAKDRLGLLRPRSLQSGPVAGPASVQQGEVPIEDRPGQGPDLRLLHLDRSAGVDRRQPILVDHVVVLLDDAPLEVPVARPSVAARVEVQARFIELEAVAAGARQ